MDCILFAIPFYTFIIAKEDMSPKLRATVKLALDNALPPVDGEFNTAQVCHAKIAEFETIVALQALFNELQMCARWNVDGDYRVIKWRADLGLDGSEKNFWKLVHAQSMILSKSINPAARIVDNLLLTMYNKEMYRMSMKSLRMCGNNNNTE